MKKNIVSVVFGGGISTMGISVVLDAIDEEIKEKTNIKKCLPGDIKKIKEADILLISLYWWENILELIRLLNKTGINPRKKQPIIIIGGSSAVNVKLLKPWYHYSVLGDGEVSINKLLEEIIKGNYDYTDDGIYNNIIGESTKNKKLRTSPIIPPSLYVENRDNKTARIELARGCRFKCGFCQISHIKPYREQPFSIVKHLITQCKTKSLGLFAPDRTGYSSYQAVEREVLKQGKHNTAEDARLDMIQKYRYVNKIKFGIEGFTEKQRKKFRKIPTNDKLIKGFKYLFNELKNYKGKALTTATIYMIGDLPEERSEECIKEFYDTLAECDKFCNRKFTLFLTVNSFNPMPFTPMERESIEPYNDFNKWWARAPILPNMTIAKRGGMKGSANRITALICSRGDERLSRVINYLALNPKILNNNKMAGGKALEKLIVTQGVKPEKIINGKDIILPHSNFTIEGVA